LTRILSSTKKSIEDCAICKSSYGTSANIEEIMYIKSLGPWERFTTKLPFASYLRPQYRGQNVWYGTTDFVLHTPYGKVLNEVIDGVIKTQWEVYQDRFLDQLWHLYKLFCESRGVDLPRVVYGNTGFNMRRMAFNTLHTPFYPESDDFQLILENSSLHHSDYYEITLTTDSDCRPTLDGDPVDFNIYHVYDINESFFVGHNLKTLSSLILPVERAISSSVLINNFLETKIYQVLMLDNTHRSGSNIKDKYKNINMLGSLGSFTRALCLANEISLIKYRSSISDSRVRNTVLESQTIQDIPLIDLYKSSSMARVTFHQQKTLIKMAEGEDLDDRDFAILNSLADRLGLVTSATMLVNFKSIIGTLDPTQFNKILPTQKTSCIIKLIEVIHECMNPFRKKITTHQWTTSRNNYWRNFVVLYKALLKVAKRAMRLPSKTKRINCTMLAEHMVYGLIRAVSDNEVKSWNIRREDVLASLLPTSFLGVQNLYFTLNILLSDVMIYCQDEFSSYIESKKYFSMFVKSNIEEGEELAEENEMFEEHENDTVTRDISNYNFPPMVVGEEEMDDVSSGDIPEEFEKRTWGGEEEEETIVLNSTKDLLKGISYTLQKNFSTLKIYYLASYLNFTWLGPGNYFKEQIGDFEYYVSAFPGEKHLPRSIKDEALLIKKNERAFEDAYKACMDKKSKKKVEDKIDEVSSFFGDEYKEYFKQSFKENNLIPTSTVSSWYSLDANTLEDTLKTVLEQYLRKRPQTRQLTKKNYLPGFSGVLRDPTLVSELSSIFGTNYFFLTTGQIRINKKVIKMIMNTIRGLYYKVNKHHKAFLTFILSCLREAVLVDGDSDVEVTDTIFGYLGDLQDQYDVEEKFGDNVAPDPQNTGALIGQYVDRYAVSWANLYKEEEKSDDLE
jgi:hypothetical protein